MSQIKGVVSTQSGPGLGYPFNLPPLTVYFIIVLPNSCGQRQHKVSPIVAKSAGAGWEGERNSTGCTHPLCPPDTLISMALLCLVPMARQQHRAWHPLIIGAWTRCLPYPTLVMWCQNGIPKWFGCQNHEEEQDFMETLWINNISYILVLSSFSHAELGAAFWNAWLEHIYVVTVVY